MMRYRAWWMLAGLSLVGCHDKQTSRFETHVIGAGPMTETISATGEVTARNRVNIGSQVSGTIAKVHVDFNAAVHAGDVLAEVAPQVFVAQAARAEASLAVAEADVERAQLELRAAVRTQGRHTKLAQDQMLAAADIDKSNVAVDAARANMKKAQAAVLQAKADTAQAQANLALTQIRSPIDGVVLDRQVEVGQTVAAQFQVATLFVVVGDMRSVQVIVNIDEADVGQIQTGMPVRFSVDAYPQLRFVGRLHSLRQAPVGMSQQAPNTAGVVTYAAVIEADNPNAALMQGMTAQAAIEKAHRDTAVKVPLAALRFVPHDAAEVAAQDKPAADAARDASSTTDTTEMPGGKTGAVWLLDGAVPTQRRVQLGMSDGRFVEAVSGVAAGDVVIVGQSGKPKDVSTKGLRRARH